MAAADRKPSPAFQPWIPATEAPAEFTFRAVALGSVLGIVFGAASVYLGLKVGLTTSASIPIAVMAITILKKLGNSTILENNIVQTTGSAGESVAAAVVFTIPALIFLGFPMRIPVTFLIALTGGVLGVLMMIPLRRYLIVKEHGTLRFPEGTACAEILIAGEQGGTSRDEAPRRLQGQRGARVFLLPRLPARVRDVAGASRRGLHHRIRNERRHGRGRPPGVADPRTDGRVLREPPRRTPGPRHDTHPGHGLCRSQGQVPALHRRGGRRDGRHSRARAGSAVDLGISRGVREAAPRGRCRGGKGRESRSWSSSRSCPSSA
jgi:hypothetical protein